MTDTAGGTGAANDPTIVVENNVPALEAALEAARLRALAEEAGQELRAAQAKVDELRIDLAAAEAYLASLEA